MRYTGYTLAGPIGTLLLALLGGCATQLDLQAITRPGNAENGSSSQVIQFQRLSLPHATDPELVVAEDLRPGDILLTSARTFRSSAIRVMTLAPVSHAALYIGDGRIAEAVAPDVRIRTLDELLDDEVVVMAFRHPDLTAKHAKSIHRYALERAGGSFNFFGVAMHAPYGITRRACELPLMPELLRDVCIRGVGGIFHLVTSKEQMFCSQFVLEAYQHAGLSITDVDPRLLSPADILHMREGDVSSVKIHRTLRQVGYLKFQQPMLIAAEQ
jgi:hypothetical protein